jgi:glycolate oxidase FAD binding subunit
MTMTDCDLTSELQARVREAAERGTPLAIRGGGGKAFYGRALQGEPLDVSGHRGVVSYETTELVITARAGTPLAEVEALLAGRGQMLPFEPPHFGGQATIGGMVAAGLSGPARPWAGAVRDAVLGVKILNGRGEILSFGGQVMKNVAGYDLSRLMAGALGTLGVILEVSLKVLPRPALMNTLVQELDAAGAARHLAAWGRQPLPISATLHLEDRLYIRLSGTALGVAAAHKAIGGEAADAGIWEDLREQRLDFFQTELPLWRLSLPAAARRLDLPGDSLSEWGGALRWLKTGLPAAKVRAAAAVAGGHATLFRGQDGQGEVFQPLSPVLMGLHQRLKQSLDPRGILNPGRMYAGL